MRSSRSRLQQAADNVGVHLYEHFHVHDKPPLELAVGWISRERIDFVPFIRGARVLC